MARKGEKDHSGSAGSGDPAVEYGYSLTGTTPVECGRIPLPVPTPAKCGIVGNGAHNRAEAMGLGDLSRSGQSPMSGKTPGPPPDAPQGRAAEDEDVLAAERCLTRRRRPLRISIRSHKRGIQHVRQQSQPGFRHGHECRHGKECNNVYGVPWRPRISSRINKG
jgi:hypothetical protein